MSTATCTFWKIMPSENIFRHSLGNSVWTLSTQNCKTYSNVFKCPKGVSGKVSGDTIWHQKTGSTLAQVMACCLTAPSHYLNQYWLLMNSVLWHLPENNFIGISQTIIRKMTLKVIISRSLSPLSGVDDLNRALDWPTFLQCLQLSDMYISMV